MQKRRQEMQSVLQRQYSVILSLTAPHFSKSTNYKVILSEMQKTMKRERGSNMNEKYHNIGQ